MYLKGQQVYPFLFVIKINPNLFIEKKREKISRKHLYIFISSRKHFIHLTKFLMEDQINNYFNNQIAIYLSLS